jgi:hypothetical protein
LAQKPHHAGDTRSFLVRRGSAKKAVQGNPGSAMSAMMLGSSPPMAPMASSMARGSPSASAYPSAYPQPMQTGGGFLNDRREARGPVSPYGTRTQTQQPPNPCCEPKDTLRATDWSYVGENRGNYEKVETFSYVGEGSGNYQQRQVEFTRSSQPRSICVCLLVTAAVMSLVYLTFSLLSRHSFFHGGSTGNKLSFDCDEGTWNWKKGWSREKKAYCCDRTGTGCERPTAAPTQPPIILTTPCPHPHPTTHPPHRPHPQGCDMKCHDWSCKDRMIWQARTEFPNNPHACMLGYKKVLGQCPVCSACPLPTLLQSNVCKVPATTLPPTTTPPQLPSGGSGCSAICASDGHSSTCADRIKSVANTRYLSFTNKCSKALGQVLMQCGVCSGCSLAHSGCLSPGPLTTSLPFDCVAGFSNWQHGWSIAKKTWCCTNQNRGCERST